MATRPLDDATRHELYEWLDSIPLSRPKKFISRDFADAYLLAEVIAHYQPRMVELHNYPAALSLANKRVNWETLQSKVLRKLRVSLSRDDIEALANAMPNAIERVLLQVRPALERLAAQQEQEAVPGARGARERERNHIPGEGRMGARAEAPADPRTNARRPGPTQPLQRQPRRTAAPGEPAVEGAQDRVRDLYREEGNAAAQVGRATEHRSVGGYPLDTRDLESVGVRDYRDQRDPHDQRDPRDPRDIRGAYDPYDDYGAYGADNAVAASAASAASATSAVSASASNATEVGLYRSHPPEFPDASGAPAAPVAQARTDARPKPTRQSPAARAPTDEEYERLQAKLQAADAERILMCQKIENLEKLLHMKDSRIAAMNAKIQNLTAKVQALEAQ